MNFFFPLEKILKQVNLQKPYIFVCPQTFAFLFFFSVQVTFKHILSLLKGKKKSLTYAKGFECYKTNLHDGIDFVCLPSCMGTMNEPI